MIHYTAKIIRWIIVSLIYTNNYFLTIIIKYVHNKKKKKNYHELHQIRFVELKTKLTQKMN